MSEKHERHLDPLSELVERFLRLKKGESQVVVVLSCGAEHAILSFPAESLESQMLQRELSSCKPESRIALIKTNEALRPLLVRIIGT